MGHRPFLTVLVNRKFQMPLSGIEMFLCHILIVTSITTQPTEIPDIVITVTFLNSLTEICLFIALSLHIC
jgi:hypothetical protein